MPTPLINYIDLAADSFNWVFTYQEIGIYIFLAFVTLLLIKGKVDRIGFTFIGVLALGTLFFYGVLPSPLLWGIALIAVGVITAVGVLRLMGG